MTVFIFSGQNQYISKTITNAYSGQTYELDGQYLMNNSTYTGAPNVTDILFMSVEHDVLFLVDEFDNETFSSIETFLGSVGNDVMDFSSTTHVLMNLTIVADDGNDVVWSNAGNDHVLGGRGNDILHGGPGDDQIRGEDDNDTLNGGDGNDLMLGGNGHDWLSGDVGADSLNGGDGIDTIDYTYSAQGVVVNLLTGTGQGGDAQGDTISNVEDINGSAHEDILTGNDANNILRGEDGNDWLAGGNGDDILYGGNSDVVMLQIHDFIDTVQFPHLKEGVNISNLAPPGTPALGIANSNLDFDFDTTATISFAKGYAGYNNTLGVYRIAQDGTIEAASILWNNVKTAGYNTSHTIDLPFDEAGGQIGFFIISNGSNQNNYSGLDTGEQGNIKFIYHYGQPDERPATVNDLGSQVRVVYDDGVTEKLLKGDHYHTTDRDGSTTLNSDGAAHVVSGVVSNGDVESLRIGFEDLRNRGDADYEDVLFNLTINSDSAPATFIGDVLIGGAGNDTLYGGAGSDILVVGNGLDQIHGGADKDLIVFDTMDGLADIIHGFETGSSGDILNITDILQGYDATTDAIADFVRLVDNGGHTELQVNQDGDAGGAFTALAIFNGGMGDTLQDLISNGNLVMDQTANY